MAVHTYTLQLLWAWTSDTALRSSSADVNMRGISKIYNGPNVCVTYAIRQAATLLQHFKS